MKKNVLLTVLISIIYSLSFISVAQAQEKEKEKEEQEERDGAMQAIERDIFMMKDPLTNEVPTERLLIAKKYKDQLMQSSQNLGPLTGVSWKEQGPTNLGGRTRAIMIDPNDVSGNTVWAGSVGGGLWKTTNISLATPIWNPVNDLFNNLAVTSISYNPANPLIMYFCTGEGYGNIDAIRGLGVWKSTDGGLNWSQLASTNNSTFYFCQKVVVNSTGIVFVATSGGGLQRSADGGTTWTKVLGTGLAIGGAVSNFCYDVEIAANGDVYSSLSGSVHKSVNAGVTFAAAQTLGLAATRIELACAPNDANYVYAILENGNSVNGILRTINGGTNWVVRTEPADADPGVPTTDFSNGQAWYDLAVAVDPLNKDRLFVGGLDIFVSTDGAGTWSQVSHWYGGFGFQYAHADQHNIVFQNGSSSIAYFVNDGGVYRSANANAVTPTLAEKSMNYRTAQFYACALHPTAQTSYFLAGSQDNGTHKFTSFGLQTTTEATGGDGAFCHIDQDQPQFQFTQYVFNDYYRSSDGGVSWTNVTFGGSGQFINPSDYDDVNNRMYAANNSNQYLRWDDPQTGGTFVTIAAAALNGQVSAVKVSPNTANRVFFGSASGRVVRVDNANTAAPTITNITAGLPVGAYVSCVEVETGNDNHLLATFSNYGVNSVWESINGGTLWTSVEGNLPDMPIRWALFNPNNNDQAIIATELGVWSTDNLNGVTTNWGATNTGLANVRVDMLQLRQSDKFVIAATHGRGMYASDLFTAATSIFRSDIQVSYINKSIQFTSDSYKATSWSWNFGDGTALSTLENPTHIYTTAGKFDVTLTINGGASTLTKTQYIQILPNRGTPYVVATDGGTFEINPNDFGSQSISGNTNKWERGVPANFLITANSPVNVWKTDLDADITSGDYACVLQTPSYNLTNSSSAYTLRFRRSMEVAFCNGPFAVQLQYSTDRGQNWTRLGVDADPSATNWYNRGPSTGCPIDASIFPDRYGWTLTSNNILCTYNITTGAPALIGQPEVTFRFVLSVKPGYSASGYAVDGFMVDDFEMLGPVNAPYSPFGTIITTGTLSPFVSCTGIASAQQSFTVSGTGLTANLLITPPAGFEVSTTSGAGFASSVSLVPSSGNVPATTIFIRITAAASGTPSGIVACSSTGATTQNVSASGTVFTVALTSLSQTNVSCNGGTNGAASVNAATGGTPAYAYNWIPGNPTGDGTTSVSGLIFGNWTCIVTDANGCTASRNFAISQPATLVLTSLTQTNVSCFGGANGAASVNAATGGVGPYIYNWTPGNPTGDGTTTVTGLTAGTWTCTVTDANGCTATTTRSITQPTALIFTSLAQTNVSCFGGANGAASVNVASGGTGSYSYNWTPGNPTGDGTTSVTGLTAGVWTCTATDNSFCTATTTRTITQPAALALTSLSQTNVSCFGGTNGAASVNPATGGVGPYTYNWTPGNPAGDGTTAVSGLIAGAWTVIVTDANGCTASVGFNITQPAQVVPTISGSLSFCAGSSTLLSATAGFTSYLWSTGAITSSISVNTASAFTVTVTNASGCTGTASVLTTIGLSVSPVITGNPTSVLMFQDFESGILPSGWSASGLWHVTAACVSGTPPNPTKWAYYGIDASCNFNNSFTNTGNLTTNTIVIPANASSANLRFRYAYNGEGGAPPSGFDNASLKISVNGGAFNQAVALSNTGSAGSWLSAEVNLNAYIGNAITLQWNFNTVDAISNTGLGLQIDSVAVMAVNPFSVCAGTTLNLNASSGYSSYAWSTGAVTQAIVASGPGTYTVTVSNASGCTGSASVVVNIYPNPAPAISGITAICPGGSTTLNAGAFSAYVWSTGATSQTTSVNTIGTFTVTVTNVNGCSGTASVTTSVSAVPAPVITGNAPSTLLFQDFEAGAVPVGWTATGLWHVTAACVSGTPPNPTKWAYYGIDASCTFNNGVTNSGNLTTNTITIPTFATSANLRFKYAYNGEGGVPPSGWDWALLNISVNGGAFTQLATLSNTGSGGNWLTAQINLTPYIGSNVALQWNFNTVDAVANNFLGLQIDSVAVTSNTGLTICAGNSVTLNAGVGFASYVWSTGASTQTIPVSAAGTYTVTVTNANGCSGLASAVINVNANPVPVITGTPTFCFGSSAALSTGSFSSYNWSNGATTQSVSLNTANTFTVTVTNGNGCAGSASVTTLLFLCPLQLNLRAFIEGFYSGGGVMQAVVDPINSPSLCDTITVELRNSIAPFNLQSSIKGTLSTTGYGQFIFPGNTLSKQYYIVVRSRNAIETWSKFPILMDNPIEIFDFTTP